MIVIGFSTTGKFMSGVIRFFTRSKVSHAWIGFDDDTLGQKMVMQAELMGFEVIPLKRWKGKNKLVSVFHAESIDLGEGLRKIAKDIGAEYDFRSAFFVGIKRWFYKKSRRLLSSPKKLMCSEAVARMLVEAGVECVEGIDPELVSPGELMGIIEASDSFAETNFWVQ